MIDIEFVDYHMTDIDVSLSYKRYMIDAGIILPQNLLKACLKRQCEFLAGRHCASRVLQQLGERPHTLPIGKFREPIWPEDIVGSISHCRTQAIVVCAKKANFKSVGVDLELNIANDIAKKIGPQIISKAEDEFCSHFDCYSEFITCIFSAKEAVFKAIFPIINQPINFGYIQLQGIDNNNLIFSLTEKFNQHFRVAVRYYQLDKRVLNVCTINVQD